MLLWKRTLRTASSERYAMPLPELTDEVAALAAMVDGHLKKMGAVL
jgi:type I restriction enzyme M protein